MELKLIKSDNLYDYYENERGEKLRVSKKCQENYNPNPENPTFICQDCHIMKYGDRPRTFMLIRTCSFCGTCWMGIWYPPKQHGEMVDKYIEITPVDDDE